MAKELGVTQQPGQSDREFVEWLHNLRRHRGLINEAKDWGVQLCFGMTSAELRQAICDRQIKLLQERGFTVNARVAIFDRNVEIREIVQKEGKSSTIIVKYWIIE